MRIACVIQGDIRDNFNTICEAILKLFDVVIVSTWQSEESKISYNSKIHYIFNNFPAERGFSNRNLQRLSTSSGIRLAKELKCDFVLKWRTDMLPTKLNLKLLYELSQYKIPFGLKSRLVMCSFRNLTVNEDWFSSFPDIFAFGDIDHMQLLWSDDGFDYTKKYNPPQRMKLDCDLNLFSDNELLSLWCAESELYAIYRNRLSEKYNFDLKHETIVKNYIRLLDHKRLGIVWFGSDGKFRPIFQACQHPWWTEKVWAGLKPVKYVNKGYEIPGFFSYIKSKLNFISKYREVFYQKVLFNKYKNDFK